VIEACANVGGELRRRAHEMKECRRVHLMFGEICEQRELL
jgi:hypothetical protein